MKTFNELFNATKDKKEAKKDLIKEEMLSNLESELRNAKSQKIDAEVKIQDELFKLNKCDFDLIVQQKQNMFILDQHIKNLESLRTELFSESTDE